MAAVSPPPLLVLSPIEPRTSGNGLAMRAATMVAAARALADVTVVVVPVAGTPPGRPSDLRVPVHVAAPVPPGRSRAATAALLAVATWRDLLAEIGHVPGLPVASPALAASVVPASMMTGTAVLALRSYLGPLGLAVAERLQAPWTALDLDDDDEAVASAQGSDAAAVRRLVAAVATRYDAVSLASPVDAEGVARRLGVGTHTVPNAVAVPAVRPPARPGRDRVLFVGNLSYPPNVGAAMDLAERVVPEVRRRLGRPVRLQLVGAHRADGPLPRLATLPGVEVTGWVEDLAPLYAAADVVVAPLAVGSGTRIKLLEAFAMGVPVVTTPVGSAGLAVRAGTHLLVGHTPDQVAAATAAVLDDTALGDRLAAAAFDLVSARYAHAVVAGDVAGFLAAAADHGTRRAPAVRATAGRRRRP